MAMLPRKLSIDKVTTLEMIEKTKMPPLSAKPDPSLDLCRINNALCDGNAIRYRENGPIALRDCFWG